MLEAEVQLFAIALEAYFSRPRPFAKEKLDQLAVWLTDAAEGFALSPDQVRLRQTDLVFDYELSASLFGGNASFRLNSERVTLSARGARTQQDADILHQTAARFVKAVAAPDQLDIAFSANAHALLASEEERETYLAGFRPSRQVVSPGALGFVQVAGWPEDIRVAIEASIGMSSGLFISWITRFRSSDASFQALQGLVTALGAATQVYGVKFKPLH